eukprot:2182103-Rhodomonas_salina.1
MLLVRVLGHDANGREDERLPSLCVLESKERSQMTRLSERILANKVHTFTVCALTGRKFIGHFPPALRIAVEQHVVYERVTKPFGFNFQISNLSSPFVTCPSVSITLTPRRMRAMQRRKELENLSISKYMQAPSYVLYRTGRPWLLFLLLDTMQCSCACSPQLSRPRSLLPVQTQWVNTLTESSSGHCNQGRAFAHRRAVLAVAKVAVDRLSPKLHPHLPASASAHVQGLLRERCAASHFLFHCSRQRATEERNLTSVIHEVDNGNGGNESPQRTGHGGAPGPPDVRRVGAAGPREAATHTVTGLRLELLSGSVTVVDAPPLPFSLAKLNCGNVPPA